MLKCLSWQLKYCFAFVAAKVFGLAVDHIWFDQIMFGLTKTMFGLIKTTFDLAKNHVCFGN
jgi:hypothetical protein